MFRLIPLSLALFAFSAAQAQTAPVVRSTPGSAQVNTTRPAPGVWLRTDPMSSVKTLSTTGDATEIKVERGRANVEIHNAKPNGEILVDLPAGQVSLLKDGIYTFNAETNTVRVLRGEADAYLGANTSAKPIKVKEEHEFAFAPNTKPREVDDYRAMSADLLQAGPTDRGDGPGYGGGRGYGYAPGYGYAEGPYGDGPVYPYPYYGYGYGYPYFGYPFGFGLGFGYYGGFGGFRGGGFRGGRLR